jgi:hypothetical protein
MQATIIGRLRRKPGLTCRARRSARIPKVTVANGLEKLMVVALIIADPTRDVAMRVQRVRYTVDDAPGGRDGHATWAGTRGVLSGKFSGQLLRADALRPRRIS